MNPAFEYGLVRSQCRVQALRIGHRTPRRLAAAEGLRNCAEKLTNHLEICRPRSLSGRPQGPGQVETAARRSAEQDDPHNLTRCRATACRATTPFEPAGYLGKAGNTGSFSTSRASCWMMSVAFRFAAIFLMRSIEATVWA